MWRKLKVWSKLTKQSKRDYMIWTNFFFLSDTSTQTNVVTWFHESDAQDHKWTLEHWWVTDEL